MAITVDQAEAYFANHYFKEAWLSHLERDSALIKAENDILAFYGDKLNEESKAKTSYMNAVFEQALHIIQFSKERYRLQMENVQSYKVEDISFNMGQGFISPISHALIKPLLKKRVGDIV